MSDGKVFKSVGAATEKDLARTICLKPVDAGILSSQSIVQGLNQ